MKVFSLTQSNYDGDSSKDYTHDSKTKLDFEMDVSNCFKECALESINQENLKDFIFIDDLIKAVDEKLINLGYRYVEIEAEVMIQDYGMVEEFHSEILDLVGSDSFGRIIKYNKGLYQTIFREHLNRKN